MSIQDLGAIGEIVGAIAVLLTLLYLAKQIKHNSDIAKITSYHQAIDQIVRSGMDPDFSILATKIERGESLTPEEQTRSNALATIFIYGHEILLHLLNQGQVDNRLWENVISNNMVSLKSDMMLPVLRERTGPISLELLELVESATQ
jgi:hypothetical protein